MAQRASYWSNSRLADFIRGTKKPGAETASGWNKWEKASKEKHPIRYWIVEEGFDAVQNTLWWPIDKLYDVKYYCVNRFVTRTHALTSATLKRGEWAEFGTRVLHCNFDELVNFVEVETAAHHVAWGDDETRAKYKRPWHATGWFKLRTWRCPQAGLDHLYWASSLTFGEDMGIKPGREGYGDPTPQALTAKETLVLYLWWTKVRPARKDPYDASGWSDLCKQREEKAKENGKEGFMAMFDHDDETPEEAKAHSDSMDRLHDLEAEYEKEDEEMLVRLAKLSSKLWT